MQFDRSADGTLTPLPKPSVDTGAGLERIASVLQGEDSNFHTDLFMPLIQRVAQLVGKPYDRGPAGGSFRVLADHARAVTFLLTDGVYPSNEGRGYVLRRILRRAVRHAWLLGRKEPTLAPLTELVVAEMGEAYPELRGISLEPIQGKLMWLPIRKGMMRLVWNFQIHTLDQDHVYDFTIDAVVPGKLGHDLTRWLLINTVCMPVRLKAPIM